MRGKRVGLVQLKLVHDRIQTSLDMLGNKALRTHDSIRARSRLRACRSSFVGGSRHVWSFLLR